MPVLDNQKEELVAQKGFGKVTDIPKGHTVTCYRGYWIASHLDENPKMFLEGKWVEVNPFYEEPIDNFIERRNNAST